MVSLAFLSTHRFGRCVFPSSVPAARYGRWLFALSVPAARYATRPFALSVPAAYIGQSAFWPWTRHAKPPITSWGHSSGLNSLVGTWIGVFRRVEVTVVSSTRRKGAGADGLERVGVTPVASTRRKEPGTGGLGELGSLQCPQLTRRDLDRRFPESWGHSSVLNSSFGFLGLRRAGDLVGGALLP